MRESLKAFAKHVGDTSHFPFKIAEIGVMAGGNAEIINNTLHPRKLYLIDSWSTDYRPVMHDRLKETAARFEGKENVCIIKDSSEEALCLFQDNTFDYVYLDNAHNYEHVLNEMYMWWRKVKKGGMLAGHDINGCYPERVLRAVQEFAKEKNVKYYSKQNEKEDVGDWWIWKN